MTVMTGDSSFLWKCEVTFTSEKTHLRNQVWKDGLLVASRRDGEFVLELYDIENLGESTFVEEKEVSEVEADPAAFSEGSVDRGSEGGKALLLPLSFNREWLHGL
uniref:Uncharacterized protein n=1 Tax=Chromera velia CCMP2878 TaxID=1169474 RepID=A0A0G4H241_9ALVE|eukprot:Cvel_24305.t1-p1 / transcript=Cvel_24305.t1 / gene=Cvel_24305 / organism=Chromera_velia_CCMP2878 / gene_product=hypothetical protein / transcript_product=hypothetical protein / location=Cvel_scaffold2611:106-677(-) / protein_length=104 / sequence_SO=supercontig / SO=protein_coding / is_pseudo=false